MSYWSLTAEFHVNYYQKNRGPTLLAIAYSLATISTVAVALRLWARRLVKQPWGYDDYTTCAAQVVIYACTFIITNSLRPPQ